MPSPRKERTLPSFRIGDYVVVAYVPGRYTPPGRGIGKRGFLGIYFSKQDGFRFITTAADDGRILAGKSTMRPDVNLEFTIIQAAIDYTFRFQEWRLFPLTSKERRIIRSLRLVDEMHAMRRTVANMLYLARLRSYLPIIDKLAAKSPLGMENALRPIFTVRSHSPATIRRDIAERDEIWRLVFEKK